MVFGPNAGDPIRGDVAAPPDSDAYYLGLMAHQFPGSFLPLGPEQIVRTASPHLELVESSSGRLDYIETISRWRRRFAEPSLRKTLLKARLVPRWLISREFRLAFTSGVSANTVCFERELLEHYRMVFERPAGRPATHDRASRPLTPASRPASLGSEPSVGNGADYGCRCPAVR